jgi:hypothetical protein
LAITDRLFTLAPALRPVVKKIKVHEAVEAKITRFAQLAGGSDTISVIAKSISGVPGFHCSYPS